MGTSNQASKVEKSSTTMLKAWTKDVQAWDDELLIDGKRMTPADVVAQIQGICDRHKNVRTCRAQFKAAVRTRNSAIAKDLAFLTNLGHLVRAKWGPALVQVKSYGLQPIKRRGKLGVDEQVIAKAREKETRAIRGTKGKRQRLAITTEPKPTVVVRGIGGKGKSGEGEK
jgi:hypothetical protein